MQTAVTALANLTALSFTHTRNAVSLVFEEHLLTAAQGGTCSILHTERCVFIPPDNFHNMSQAHWVIKSYTSWL